MLISTSATTKSRNLEVKKVSCNKFEKLVELIIKMCLKPVCFIRFQSLSIVYLYGSEAIKTCLKTGLTLGGFYFAKTG